MGSSEAALGFKLLTSFIRAEFKAMSQPFRARANLIPGVTLFIVIFMTNFLGLLPYVSPHIGPFTLCYFFGSPTMVGTCLIRVSWTTSENTGTSRPNWVTGGTYTIYGCY